MLCGIRVHIGGNRDREVCAALSLLPWADKWREPSGTLGLNIRERLLLHHVLCTSVALIFPSCGRAQDGDNEFHKVSEQDCMFPIKRAASVVFSTSWNHECLKSN